jgi:hypothetical protein
MDSLAQEKQVLEQMLMQEKQLLNNEKQGLSVQLCETENLLGRERAVKAQLEAENRQLELDKNDLQNNLQERMDEIVLLKNELLKMQANYERDRRQIESFQARAEEQSAALFQASSSLDAEERKRQQSELLQEEQLKYVLAITLLVRY